MSVKMVNGYSMPNEVRGGSAYGGFAGHTGGPAAGVRPYWAGQNLTSAQFNDYQQFQQMAGCNCGGQRMGTPPTLPPGGLTGPALPQADGSKGLGVLAAVGVGLALFSMFGKKKR